jgi:purine-nucleoside phosphorylase
MNDTTNRDDGDDADGETARSRRERHTVRRPRTMTRKTPAAQVPKEKEKKEEPQKTKETVAKKPVARRRPAPAPKKEAAPAFDDVDDGEDPDGLDKPKPGRLRRRTPSAVPAKKEAVPVRKEAAPTVDADDDDGSDEEEEKPKTGRRRRRRRPSSSRAGTAPTVADDEEEDENPKTGRPPVDRRPAPQRRPAPAAPVRKEPTPVDDRPDRQTAAKQSSSRNRGGRIPEKGPARPLKPVVAEGYELRHMPDGTLVRAEITKKNRRGDGGRRRSYGDEGPGPAIVPFEDTPYLAPSERAARSGGMSLGNLPAKCRRSVNYLKRRLPFVPRVAVILGSGLGDVAELSGSEDTIDFADIPDFPTPTAPGHDGVIRIGMVEGTPTLFCEGRIHFYETGSMEDTVYPIQTFLALGVEKVILTTSAGSLNPAFRTGDIMFVADQINLTGDNPFFGGDPQENPSIFVDATAVYDEVILRNADRLARRARVTAREGVLVAMRGPVYETPAERRMLATLGGDAVSMSVAPEALAAAQTGATVVGLAVIVNDASEASRRPASHEEVLESGRRHATGLKRLVTAIIGQGW